MTTAILLVAASLFAVTLEVLFVSFGVLTLVAVGLGTAGAIAAFHESQAFGWSMLGALIVGMPLMVKFTFMLLPKLPFGRGFHLAPPELTDGERRAGAGAATADLLGRIGQVTSPLRPSGTAEIEGKPVHVMSRAGMIAPGTLVKVVDTSGNRVVVEELETPQNPET